MGRIRHELIVGGEVGGDGKRGRLERVRRPEMDVERDLSVGLLKLI